MLVSKYGVFDVLQPGRVVLGPLRVCASPFRQLNVGPSDPNEDLTNVLITLEGHADWKTFTRSLHSIEGSVSVHVAQTDTRSTIIPE
jgi:hypothetical protein